MSNIYDGIWTAFQIQIIMLMVVIILMIMIVGLHIWHEYQSNIWSSICYLSHTTL